MKDFTKAQAKRWVAQEAAKHPTPESKAARIATEEAFTGHASYLAKELPNAYQAHLDLIRVLSGDAPKK